MFYIPMKELGLGLLIIGAISLVLPFVNPNLHYVFLTWIENWGHTMAWVIRGGITLLGLVLWLGFRHRD
jgi:hypothetical protein